MPVVAFEDLTPESCRRLNDEAPDAPNVRYYSVAGRFNASWLNPAWRLPWSVIRDQEGENDGLVPVSSATWGETCDVWEGDHLSLVNYPDPLRKAAGRWRNRTPAFALLLRRAAGGSRPRRPPEGRPLP